MTDNQAKEQAENVEPESKEQLDANGSVELSEEDKKIAAKRAKKKGVPVELSEEARRQELNTKQAQHLTIEFNSKLNALGFVLQPVLRRFPDSITAGFDLRPMDANELMQFKAAMEAKGQKENDVMAPNVTGKGGEEDTTPKVESSEVEPAEIPA